MSKRPTDDLEPAAKKRGNSRQLTKDDNSDEEEEDRGVADTAPEEVLKTRRIVRARRGTGAPPSTPTAGAPKAAASANPFAGINILTSLNNQADEKDDPSSKAIKGSAKNAPGVESKVHEVEEKPESQPAAGNIPSSMNAQVDGTKQPEAGAETTTGNVEKKENKAVSSTAEEVNEGRPRQGDEKAVGSSGSTFASLAGGNAPFASFGTSKGFSFGTVANGGNSATNGSATGAEPGKPFSFSTPSAAFSFPPKESIFPAVTSIFGTSSSTTQTGGDADAPQSDNIKPALATLPPELETVTGEEDEETLWSGEGSLYEFGAARSWKERGKGELRINKAPGRPARFVMRQRGQHRLLMNANLWPQMKVTPMDGGKGATFPVVNVAKGSEEAGDTKLQTFAFRLKAASQLNPFVDAINEHKLQQEKTHQVAQ